MGSLVYGVSPAINMDDRMLRHVQYVITTKLRRGEPFSLHWDNEPVADEAALREAAHGSVWLSSASQLYFSYDGRRRDVPLSKAWVEAMMQAAYSADGFTIPSEPLPVASS